MTYPDERWPRVGGPTPWGPAQNVAEIAEGIVEVSTASHGGIWLSDERHREMPEPLRSVPTYVGLVQQEPWRGWWYEEDEDAILVILSFPRLWPPQAVWEIVDGGMRAGRPEIAQALRRWKGARRLEVEALAQSWANMHADCWIPTGLTSDGATLLVWYRQVSTGDRALRRVSEFAGYKAVPVLPGEPAGADRRSRAAS